MWYGEVEGTGIVTLDRRFNQCFAGHVRVERLWTGARWAEGPAWFAAGRYRASRGRARREPLTFPSPHELLRLVGRVRQNDSK